VAADKGDAAQRALEAGLDAELPQLDCYGAPLRERVERGLVPEALVDRSVRRVLRLKLALGLFEAPLVDEAAASAPYQTPAARRLAREIAVRSLVLLRNEGGLLPLRRDLGRVALIGPAADDARLFQGDYAYPAHAEIVFRRGAGEAGILPRADAVAFAPGPYDPPTSTLLEGVRGAVAPGTELLHARGCDVTGDDRSGFDAALAAARGADVAIVAVGGKSGLLADCTSGEFRDAADLGLTGPQQALVEAVVATGTPTVAVLVNGRPLALPWIAEHVPAVLEAWIPGEEGGRAIADVLFGRRSPAGRLPVSLPRAVGQVPTYYNHRAGGGRSQMLGDYADLPAAPLFPFGHGLSYARFEYRALRLEPARLGPHGRVRVTLEVTNAGEVESDEVVQLYVRGPLAGVTRPVKQLAGFLRLPLRPAQTRLVVFELDASQLSFYGADLRLAVEPGEVDVLVGASSADVRLEGRFRVEGERRVIRPAERVPTRAWAVA
jgi:beta-glucosidase